MISQLRCTPIRATRASGVSLANFFHQQGIQPIAEPVGKLIEVSTSSHALALPRLFKPRRILHSADLNRQPLIRPEH